MNGMSKHEWSVRCAHVLAEMVRLTRGYVTPITMSSDGKSGLALGTGNYVVVDGRPALVTNEHVAKSLGEVRLAHMPPGGSDFYAIRGFLARAWPIDLAVATACGLPAASSQFMPDSKFDAAAQPVNGELLFWLGCPATTGSRHDPVTEHNTRRSWFGHIETPFVPMLSQQYRGGLNDVDKYRGDYHMAICLPARANRPGTSTEAGVPNPSGMSGSFLWDTKYVATIASGGIWRPELASSPLKKVDSVEPLPGPRT
jgi:hypothetical protein